MICSSCGVLLADDARFCSHCGERVRPGAAQPDRLRQLLEEALGTHFRIERELGRGGMGVVYLAHEAGLDRHVAIKVLPPEKGLIDQYRERFRREARTAARLVHPNVVPLYAFGEHERMLYYVMAYVEGESLAARLHRSGQLDEPEARRILAALSDALHYAHQRGVVHRDVKPENILIEAASGRPMLTDFGISKLSDATNLTSTGLLVGTPDYMSPEQAAGSADVGPASDIYSLGVVGYAMLSGRLPFEATTPGEAIARRLTSTPAPLPVGETGVSATLANAVMRCLAREPGNRWPDAASFARAVTAVDDPEAQAPRELAALESSGVTMLLLAYAACVLWLGWKSTPSPGIALELLGKIAPPVGAAPAVLVGMFSVLAWRAGHRPASIVRSVLLEPGAWRTWYPSRWRRATDVWDRLPRNVRGTRQVFGLTFALCAVWAPFMIAAFALRMPNWQRQIADYIPLGIPVILVSGALTLGLGWWTPRQLIKKGLSEWEAGRVAYAAPLSLVAFWSRPAVAALLSPAKANTRVAARPAPTATGTDDPTVETPSPAQPTGKSG